MFRYRFFSNTFNSYSVFIMLSCKSEGWPLLEYQSTDKSLRKLEIENIHFLSRVPYFS